MSSSVEPDIEQVRRIKEELEPELLQRPGVTGVGIGYKIVGGNPTSILAIRVYVTHKRDVPETEAIPSEIRGVPTDVIERRFVLHSEEAHRIEGDPIERDL